MGSVDTQHTSLLTLEEYLRDNRSDQPANKNVLKSYAAYLRSWVKSEGLLIDKDTSKGAIKTAFLEVNKYIQAHQAELKISSYDVGQFAQGKSKDKVLSSVYEVFIDALMVADAPRKVTPKPVSTASQRQSVKSQPPISPEVPETRPVAQKATLKSLPEKRQEIKTATVVKPSFSSWFQTYLDQSGLEVVKAKGNKYKFVSSVGKSFSLSEVLGAYVQALKNWAGTDARNNPYKNAELFREAMHLVKKDAEVIGAKVDRRGMKGRYIELLSMSLDHPAVADADRDKALFELAAYNRSCTDKGRTSAVAMYADTGEVIFASNERAQVIPASTMKLVTAIAILEKFKSGEWTPDTPLTYDLKQDFDKSQAGNEMQAWFADKTVIPAGKALNFILTSSYGDITRMVARHIAGSEEEFLRTHAPDILRRYGATDTVALAVSGMYRPGQHTTALDMTNLSMNMERNFPEYRQYFSTREFSFNGVKYRHHNPALNYEGGSGYKTGTDKYGANLVAAVDHNGRKIIISIFGARDGQARRQMFEEIANLLTGKGLPENYHVEGDRTPKAQREDLVRVREAMGITEAVGPEQFKAPGHQARRMAAGRT